MTLRPARAALLVVLSLLLSLGLPRTACSQDQGQAPPPPAVPPQESAEEEAVPPAPTQPAKPPAAPPARPAPTPEPPKRPNRAVPLDLAVTAEKVARYPGNAYLLNELGNQLMRYGRISEAEARYEEASRDDPSLAIVWNNLGVAQQALGKHAAARKAYAQAIQVQPTYALAHYNLGVAYDSQGNYRKAMESYVRAIQLDRGLLDPRRNPQVVSNRHLAAVLLQAYQDRGGSFVFPVESVYPGGRLESGR